MMVREVTVGELESFVNSREYEVMNPKPITPLRAVSQAVNPSGKQKDVALIYVSEGDTLIAFAGLLPDENTQGHRPLYCNSGWWVHPELGRKYGLSVFFKALQSCNRRMFLTDCTAKTKEILERTGVFHFNAPVEGKRFILRPYLADYFKRKGRFGTLSGLFTAVDNILNLLVSNRFSRWRNKCLPQGYSMQIKDKVNEELNDFILEQSVKYHLRQDAARLNWIAGNKWLSTDKQDRTINYPFSNYTETFKQEFIVIRENQKVVGLVMLSLRDNHVSIPYIYFKDEQLYDVVRLTIGYLLEQKACSVIVYRPDILEVIQKVTIPSIVKLKVIRHYGFTTELQEEFSSNKLFQDGDGDVAFT